MTLTPLSGKGRLLRSNLPTPIASLRPRVSAKNWIEISNLSACRYLNRRHYRVGLDAVQVELQLAGLKFCDDPGTSVPIIDEMPPVQKRLAETVMTLPGTTPCASAAIRLPMPNTFLTQAANQDCSSAP